MFPLAQAEALQGVVEDMRKAQDKGLKDAQAAAKEIG